jgi:predicted nucleic acid-binding Zn ribbon protein
VPERLKKVLADMEDLSPVLRNCSLISLWAQVVDERVKKNTDPVKIKNRVLFVSTATPTWAQELNFLKSQIIKKLNDLAGEQAIVDIRFKAW